MYLSSKSDERIFLPKEKPELEKCNLESDLCKAGPSSLASWLLVQILATVSDCDDSIFLQEDVLHNGDATVLRSLMKNMMLVMVAVKTIKVVRAGSFKYWAQGYTLRSWLAVT